MLDKDIREAIDEYMDAIGRRARPRGSLREVRAIMNLVNIDEVDEAEARRYIVEAAQARGILILV